MIDNLSKAVYAFAWWMLTSLLVDEILLPSYLNLFTNFSGLSISVEIALVSCFIYFLGRDNSPYNLLKAMQ